MSADPQLVSQLKALGISENTAKYALAKCKNDVQRAADFAFSGAAAKDEVSKSKSKKTGRSQSPLKTVTEAVVVASSDSSGLSPEGSSLKARSGSVDTASSSAGQVIAQLADDAEEILSTPPPEYDPSDVSTSLPTSSARRWSTVLGLSKLIRKKGSVESLTADGHGDVAESPCDVTPTPSALSSGWSEAGDDEGNPTRGRSRSKEDERTKNPIRRLTLTRSDSSSSNTTITAYSQSVSRRNTNDELSKQASQLILQAFDRGGGTPNASSTSLNLPPSTSPTNNKRSSTSSALAALGLRAAAVGGNAISTGTPAGSNASLPLDDANTKSTFLQKSKPVGSSKGSNKEKRANEDNPQERPGRAPSPFFRARRSRSKQRARDRSPEVGALEKDRDTGPESDGESVIASRDRTGSVTKFRPQASAFEADATEDEAMTDDSADEYEKDADDYDGLDEDGLEIFDDETEKNTVANAVFFEGDAGGLGGIGPGGDYIVEDDGTLDTAGSTAGDGAAPDKRDDVNLFGEEIEVDLLGEGPNVIVPPEPLFATPTARNQGKRKTMKSGLELVTSRPAFARDRCTITLTHGEPDEALEESGKRLRRYVVLSDLSEESTYAVEWAIGTVARDGDEVFLVTVKEDESKVDPKNPADQDRASRLRVQKERQTQALLLVRQVTGLLQRTRLNITVTCQALHAKNARYMLLDLIDFLEPTMVIVGSRGLGKLKGILLGSTSHYLVQKSSVPVMVARRRLQRPLRKTNPANLRHSPRVSLASASIEKTPSSKQEDDVMDIAVTEGASDKESGTA